VGEKSTYSCYDYSKLSVLDTYCYVQNCTTFMTLLFCFCLEMCTRNCSY